MNARTSSIASAVAVIAALAALGAWHHAHEAFADVRTHFISGELQPMAGLLKENQALIKELQAEPFAEPDAAILESFLAKIRRDGVARHADMKQRLDTLAENNSAIGTLIRAYSSQAKTTAFAAEAGKFQNYSSAWRDRWNSVMELFMAGGTYAAAGVPFPQDFPAAVDAEIAAAR